MIALFDYATPSVFESDRERALLGMTANGRRPVRFHGRVTRNIPLLRFVLRTLGEVVWSNDLWSSEGDFMGWVLDPVITVHPDRIFFEAFSQDQSVYAMAILNPQLFATEGEVSTGTTNVDFTAWLWAALNELRSSRETWLRIEAGGFEVKTKNAGGRFEQKVDLPDSWVRGFLQVTGAMAMPGTRITTHAADLMADISFIHYSKKKVSPKCLRYEFNPGEEARIVLEPWEHSVRLRGAEHNYTEPRVIRTWGRRRLSLIEPLLPFATSVDIYLKGRALPSFYVVKLPDMTFVLGLSGWTEHQWTGSGSFDLLNDSAKISRATVDQVHGELANQFSATPKQLADKLQQPIETIWKACERLSRSGRAIFDVESRAFRHRELFEKPIDETKLFPPDLRTERAEDLVANGKVKIITCEPQETRKIKKFKTIEGAVTREVVYRDWRVTSEVGEQKNTEIVVGDSGRILFGVCGCSFFQENLLNKGPCEHMIALFRVSEPLRKDLPSSSPASAHAAPAHTAAMKPDEEEAEKEEEIDENDEAENDDHR